MLILGLALLAIAGWAEARRWRAAYRRSLAQFGTLLTAAPNSTLPRIPGAAAAKSAAHVKAARTRAERERAKRLAVAQRLAAEVAARGEPAEDPYGLVRSGWQ